MTTIKDIAWLAGLLEGEGSMCLVGGKYPTLSVRMTDYDVIAHAATLFGVPVNGPYHAKSRKPHWKDSWMCAVNGARAAQWLMTLYPLFGERRRAQAMKLLAAWKTSYTTYRPMVRRAPAGSMPMATCHPDRRHRAYGLCHRCYMVEYHKRQMKPPSMKRKWKSARAGQLKLPA